MSWKQIPNKSFCANLEFLILLRSVVFSFYAMNEWTKEHNVLNIFTMKPHVLGLASLVFIFWLKLVISDTSVESIIKLISLHAPDMYVLQFHSPNFDLKSLQACFPCRFAVYLITDLPVPHPADHIDFTVPNLRTWYVANAIPHFYFLCSTLHT